MKYNVLLGILCASFVLCASQAPSSNKAGYIFTSPKVLKKGSSNELHFRRFGNPDKGVINVQVLYNENYDSKNESLAADQDFQIPAGQMDVILHLKVKKFEKYAYNGRIQIKGNFGDNLISGSDSISFSDARKSILLVQTDKSIYQPGQTVKFRILRLNKDLKPYQDNDIANVVIQDPAETRLFQFNDIDLSKGIVQNEFPLSDEPVKGRWSVSVKTNDTSEDTGFEVKQYVLPKFDVKVTYPSYVLASANNIKIQICAKYTYGKPVVGSLQLNVSLDYYYYYYSSNKEKNPMLEETVNIDGCYDYSINVSKIDTGDAYSSRNIKVLAKVTEKGTGVVKDVIQHIDRQTYPLNLKFSNGQRENYKPGLPYNGKLQVTEPDDTPAVKELIEICTIIKKNRLISEWWSTRTMKLCRNYTSDHKGFIDFTVLAENVDVASINIEAKSVRYAPNHLGGKKSVLSQPQAQKYLTPFFSPSGSFIQIQPVPQPVPCGTRQTFKVLFTSKGNENYKFYYQVTKRGHLILVDNIEKSFSVKDDVSSVYENDKRLVNDKYAPIMPSKELLSKLTKEEKDCPAAKSTRYLPPIGEFNIDIDVGTRLSSEFHLLVYYIRDDRETVADSQRIDVEKCFKNKVDFKFGNKAQQPGLSTSIEIKASSNSLCGIKAIDKSLSLLNNRDQISKDGVFGRLEYLDNNQYYANNPCYKNAPQPGLASSDYRSLIRPPPPGFGSDNYEDTLTSFQLSGFVVISDFFLFTRPCMSSGGPVEYESYARPMMKMARGGPNGAPIRIVPAGPGSTPGAIIAESNSFTTSTISAKEVRNNFPETWLFEMEMTGPDGKFKGIKQLPDTVTDWLGSAICVNSEDGLGISSETSITALQAFFMEYTMPVSVIRGEEFVLVASVFSYASGALPITVSLAHSEAFQVTSSSIDGDYCLQPDTSVSLNITLKAKKVGKVDITVLAETAKSSSVCGSSPVSKSHAKDAITKKIEVEAEGFPAQDVINTLFCPSDNKDHAYENTVTLRVPKDVIPDSARALMDFTGNVMGPAIKNLNSLVALPTGCGEQIMVKFVPNIVVLDYMKSTGMLTDDIKNQAISNLNAGYQRQFNYRHYDGSFSAFGETDRQGSMFLTAFVLRSFYEAKRYIYIDDNVLKRMQDWIIHRQNRDGCFPNVGKILDIGLEGGLDEDKSSGSMTAYVLASLIISDFKNETIKEGAFTCLKNNPPTNPYSQLLYAYTAALAGKSDYAKQYIAEARQRLRSEDGMESFYIVNGTQAIRIEADSYAILSTLAIGGTASDALGYVRYLTRHLTVYGGFRSTQDTCVGLAALAQFSKLVSKDPLDLQVTTTGSLQKSVAITDKNKLVVQRFIVSKVPSNIVVKAHGTGCGLIQTSVRYNTKTPIEKKLFALHVKSECSFSGCKRATIKVLTSYLPSGQKSGMSIVEIKLLTGYVADQASLDKLKSNKILRVDIQNNAVIIYFSELSNKVSSFQFNIEQIVDVKNAYPGTAKVYDYYASEDTTSTSYVLEGFNSTSDAKVDEKEDIPIKTIIIPARF